MPFTKKEVLNIIERLTKTRIVKQIVHTKERTAIKLNSGTIVEYIH